MRTKLLAFAAAAPLLFGTTFAAAQAASASPAAPAPSASGPCGTLASTPTYTHVIWVWMENHSYDTIIGSSQAPYINSLVLCKNVCFSLRAFDAGEDLVGVLGPAERDGVVVPVAGERADRGRQLPD